jgi:dipeptidyl aminopeptidase/acylaminoacyl peptidase
MMNRNLQHRILVFFLFALIISSCKKDNDPPKPEPDYIVEYEQIMTMSADDILSRLTEFGDLPPQISLFLNHGVVVYRVVYGTKDTDDKSILASGALIVPDTVDPMPLMSFQHGTITRDEDAPSWFTSDQYLAAVFYASAGYIISLPDYIGYGTSSHLDHPYEHGHSLATASRDMLRAVYELETIEKIFSTNSKLFLTGYSQGGYATMALLKLLEEQHSAEFNITAATAGAGAYDKTGFAR